MFEITFANKTVIVPAHQFFISVENKNISKKIFFKWMT